MLTVLGTRLENNGLCCVLYCLSWSSIVREMAGHWAHMSFPVHKNDGEAVNAMVLLIGRRFGLFDEAAHSLADLWEL